jgi:5-oxoprolinase (ATP-hydrolysing)
LYSYIEHELTVGRIAKDVGFKHVSLSHEVMPMVKIVPRGYTACADAYLTPHIKKYVEVRYLIRYLYFLSIINK